MEDDLIGKTDGKQSKFAAISIYTTMMDEVCACELGNLKKINRGFKISSSTSVSPNRCSKYYLNHIRLR